MTPNKGEACGPVIDHCVACVILLFDPQQYKKTKSKNSKPWIAKAFYLKSILQKSSNETVWYCNKNRHPDQWNRKLGNKSTVV